MSESTGIYAFKSKAWIWWLFGGLWLVGFWLGGDAASSATRSGAVADHAAPSLAWDSR